MMRFRFFNLKSFWIS